MVIKPGRAKLFFNKTLQNHVSAASNFWMEADLELKVPNSAFNPFFSALTASALVFSALYF